MSRTNAWTWSITLVVTCFFGIGIGLSLGYALFASQDGPQSERAASLPESPDEAEPEREAEAPQQHEMPASGPETPEITPEIQPERAQEPTAPPKEDRIWAARHLFVAVNGQWLADGTKTFLRELRPGGVILRDSNLQSASQTLALVEDIKRAAGLGENLQDLPLIGVQHEGGSFNHLGLDQAPSAHELGQANDQARARSLGEDYARAGVARGIGVAFSPVLDVYEPGTVDPGLESRTFGSNQTIVASLGLAMAQGLREGGAISVVKHFPGYGAATYGPDGVLVVLNKDFSGLAKVMYPFNEAVRTGIQGIVVGFVAVPALDKDDPRRPAALSPILVKQLLRTRWGFNGVIVADDIAANAAALSRPIEQIAVESLAAGCDALILLDANPQRIWKVVEAIEQAVEAGTLSLEELNRSKDRLDSWRVLLERTSRDNRAVQAKVQAPIQPGAIPQGNASETNRAGEEPGPPREPIEFVADTREQRADPHPEPEETQPAPLEIAAVNQLPEVELETGDTEQETAEADPRPTGEPDVPPVAETTADGLTGEEDTAASEEIAAETDVSSAEDAPVIEVEDTVVASVRIEDLPEVESESSPVEEEAPVEATPEADLSEVTSKVVHTVVEGQMLADVASAYGVTLLDIVRWNGLESDQLEAGQELTIFIDSDESSEPELDVETVEYEEYTVKSGDTVSKIARQFRTTPEAVMKLNALDNPNRIYVGQKLRLPKSP